MQRSANLVPTAFWCLAAASIGGPAAAEPQQVMVHNAYTNDVVVTVTDLNRPFGLLIANAQPVDAGADLPVKAMLDSDGRYHLHWKAQDSGLTKSQEGDCRDVPAVTCRVDLLITP